MSIKEDENFAKALEAFYRKRGYSDLEKVRAALEAYFPQAIAEAVAAERERILRTHNISAEDDLFWDFDDREYGYNDASELLQADELEIIHIATGRNTGEMYGFSSRHENYFFKTKAEAEAAVEVIRSATK
ncbi:hypothetical protein [Gluconobacter kondonii]|uniref:hypothetical protein n=1 Tax=Gluconobacter kondonii TaxID=941463 RepID=UPI001B8D3B06|nr:hypothetical protein [Gluconobacter kondonii]MBS1079140.1 hypothetical protein [Gluconobacter kondonii]